MEASIHWCGPDMEQSRRDLLDVVKSWGGIPVVDSVSVKIVPVTDHYLHVGYWTNEEGSNTMDVAVKTARVYDLCRSMRNKVLANASIDLDIRMLILNGHLLSNPDYGTSTWAYLTGLEAQQYHRAIMFAYRILADRDRKAPRAGSPSASDLEVLHMLAVCLPRHRILISKCRLLISMFRNSM